MLNKLFVFPLFIAAVISQTVDVQFYDEEACSNVGGSCNALPQDDCCGSISDLWTSISTDNWVNVASGTEVRVHSIQGGNICAILITTIECLINEVPNTISGTAFFNGSRKRRRGPAGVTEDCENVHPIDEYFYQPGDGYRYTIDAKNPSHDTAFNAATTSVERAQYIMENFEKKIAVIPVTKIIKLTE